MITTECPYISNAHDVCVYVRERESERERICACMMEREFSSNGNYEKSAVFAHIVSSLHLLLIDLHTLILSLLHLSISNKGRHIFKL